MAFPDGSIVSTAFNPSLVAAIQDRTLSRTFRDALYPRLLYRMEALPELWPVNLGANQTFSRTGLIEPTTRPLDPNTDPDDATYSIEQWEATAAQYGRAIPTNMPTSYVTLASQYLRNMHQLGLHSGQSMNRLFRDKLFNAYVGGNTVTSASASSSATTIVVVNATGFTKQLANGRPADISANNPLQITIPALGQTVNVTGVSLTVTGDPIHGATLTLDAGLSGALPARSTILATNRARLIYSGGGNRVDDVTSAAQFQLVDVRKAVAQLRFDNVPPHEDGTYHCHLDPISELQIFGDNEFQRLNQSIPDYIHYRRFAVGHLLNTTFYRNTEAPTTATCSTNPKYGNTHGFELTNPNGVTIHRPIFTGMGAIEEKYLDESRYISEAGVQGKIGEFAIVNAGVQVMTERIRLILRAPLDKLQQVTTAAWSWSGDAPIPTDATATSSTAAFKRAVVVVHGE